MKSRRSGILNWLAVAMPFASGWFGRAPATRNWPQLRDPYYTVAKGRSLPGKPRKRLRMPPCEPGTITYRDWLVKHVGYDRRLADRMLANWRETNCKLPLPSDSQTLKAMVRL